MSDTAIDPSLVGIWVIPGQPETYEVTSDSRFHIAEPAEEVHFTSDGANMVWGGREYDRLNGRGETPIGTWKERDTSEVWVFSTDQTLEIFADGADGPITFTGIWALRLDGAQLWTRESRALLELEGDLISFVLTSGERYTYRYGVADGIWQILDIDSRAELMRYVSAKKLASVVQTA